MALPSLFIATIHFLAYRIVNIIYTSLYNSVHCKIDSKDSHVDIFTSRPLSDIFCGFLLSRPGFSTKVADLLEGC